MSASNLARLLVLSAIRSASFLYMQIGAPVLEPTLLVFAWGRA